MDLHLSAEKTGSHRNVDAPPSTHSKPHASCPKFSVTGTEWIDEQGNGAGQGILAPSREERGPAKMRCLKTPRGFPFPGPQTPILMHWPLGGRVGGRVTGRALARSSPGLAWASVGR